MLSTGPDGSRRPSIMTAAAVLMAGVAVGLIGVLAVKGFVGSGDDNGPKVDSVPGSATRDDPGAMAPATILAPDIAASTTRPPATVAPDPQVSLDQFALNVLSSDYSRISRTPCGLFAVVNSTSPARTLFLKWDGNQWEDQRRNIDQGRGASDEVATRDLTNDGVLDFLMYWGANMDRMHGFGEIISMHGSSDCTWSVLPVYSVTGDELGDNLGWNDLAGWLEVADYGPRHNVRALFSEGAGLGPHFYTEEIDPYSGP